MIYRIEYAPLAVRDLERMYAEILEASQDQETAIRYIDDLMNQIAAKSEFPKSGSPLYYEENFTGYYFVAYKAYMAFYRVDEDRMEVDRVVYARSDYIRSIFKARKQ